MIRTLEDALELVRIQGVVTEVPTPGMPSLAEAVIGEVPEGSWRHHSKGRLIYRLGRQLRASGDVLSLRLFHGKVAFVDRDLWGPVYRIVMDPPRRRRSLEQLSTSSRALLELVERDGEVRVAKDGIWTKARETLEVRLLVHSSEAHNADVGRHEAVLRAWRIWSTPALREEAFRMSYEEAARQLGRFSHSEESSPSALGPWAL